MHPHRLLLVQRLSSSPAPRTVRGPTVHVAPPSCSRSPAVCYCWLCLVGWSPAATIRVWAFNPTLSRFMCNMVLDGHVRAVSALVWTGTRWVCGAGGECKSACLVGWPLLNCGLTAVLCCAECVWLCRLYSASHDHTIKVWDPKTAKCVATVAEGHSAEITVCSMCCQSREAYTCAHYAWHVLCRNADAATCSVWHKLFLDEYWHGQCSEGTPTHAHSPSPTVQWHSPLASYHYPLPLLPLLLDGGTDLVISGWRQADGSC